MSAMSDYFHTLTDLPEVTALAAHAGTHSDPVAVIATGSRATGCQMCGYRWHMARHALTAALHPVFTDYPAANFLAMWSDVIADTRQGVAA